MEKIEELLMMLANPNIPLATKQKKFHDWKLFFYSPDAVHEFFSDSLFRNNGETNYLDIMLGTNYKDFYEMVMSLDLANMDPKAYYIYWIINSVPSSSRRLWISTVTPYAGFSPTSRRFCLIERRMANERFYNCCNRT